MSYPYKDMKYPLLERELRNEYLKHRFYQKAILEISNGIANHIAYNKKDGDEIKYQSYHFRIEEIKKEKAPALNPPFIRENQYHHLQAENKLSIVKNNTFEIYHYYCNLPIQLDFTKEIYPSVSFEDHLFLVQNGTSIIREFGLNDLQFVNNDFYIKDYLHMFHEWEQHGSISKEWKYYGDY